MRKDEHEHTKPDAQLKLHGVVYDLYLTKSEDGWGGIAYAQGADPNPPETQYHAVGVTYWEVDEDDHDFRANALGDLVGAIYQDRTPGADNDDHEHDADDDFEEG